MADMQAEGVPPMEVVPEPMAPIKQMTGFMPGRRENRRRWKVQRIAAPSRARGDAIRRKSPSRSRIASAAEMNINMVQATGNSELNRNGAEPSQELTAVIMPGGTFGTVRVIGRQAGATGEAELWSLL